MSVRSAAVRRAAQIRGERAAAFAAREAEIEQRAVEFLEASAQAENVVEAARRRCEQIMATAQAAAEQAREQSAAAVASLQELGVPRAEIAQITGLTGRQVRDLLMHRPSACTASGATKQDSIDEDVANDDASESGAAHVGEATAGAEQGETAPDRRGPATPPVSRADAQADSGCGDSAGHGAVMASQDAHDEATTRSSPV